jgi:hypothetical protein
MKSSYLIADLTAAKPGWRDSEGNCGEIWPSFCLPWFPGEPPLVGKDSKTHRRSSKINCIIPESRLELNNRGRWLWAEGWLGMARNPDSVQPEVVQMSWKPPGEEKLVGVSFPQAVRTALFQVNKSARNLCLIVPAALGPGPRQELLNELAKDFRGEILFLPRPIAVALSWCSSSAGLEILGNTKAGNGCRIGSLLVTTTSADIWEAAIVPIRIEQNNGERVLCPVHDRTQLPSETSLIGLAWEAGKFPTKTPEDVWIPRLLSNGDYCDRQVTSEGYKAAVGFLEQGLSASGIAPNWTHHGYMDDILEGVNGLASAQQLIELVHCGIKNGDQLPGGLAAIGRKVDCSTRLLSQEFFLQGAAEAMDRLEAKTTPFYEALAPLQLHVRKFNRFLDPIPDWQPLLEETEVPVGQEYRSPAPITGLSLPANDPTIDLFIRTKRRGQPLFFSINAEYQQTLDHAENVLVEARMRPGQGLAHVDIRSETPGLFNISIDEGRLEESHSPPPLEYSWPPGSAYVVSHLLIARSALAGIQNVIRENKANYVSPSTLREAKDCINQWKLPTEVDTNINSLNFPEGIDPHFIYCGALPSSSVNASPCIEEVFTPFATALEDSILRASTASARHIGLWTASWLYSRCPESVLNIVRSELQKDPPIHGSVLACAGNCFSKQEDFQLFFREFSWCIRNAYVAPKWWLRAYRNLARFRHDSLLVSSLTKIDQECILDWVLKVYEGALMEPRGDDFLYCTYLAPHLLKRRRFDSNFLLAESPPFLSLNRILCQAEVKAPSYKLRVNAHCALEFLHKKATKATLTELGQAQLA